MNHAQLSREMCRGELPERYTVFGGSEQGACPPFTSDLFLDASDSSYIFSFDIHRPQNCLYNMTLEIANAAGKVNVSKSICLCE